MTARAHPRPSHLHVPGASPVHRLAPEAAVAGTVAFVAVVAVIPRQRVEVFAAAALVLAAVVVVAGLRPATVARRLAVVVPFVAFAVAVPFVATGERVDVGWLSLSVDGLWAAWNVLAKALLGGTASIVLTATTPVPDLIAGLGRLRVPTAVVGIASFTLRYLDLVAADLARMRRAMVARGHDPRWLWQVRPIASSIGVLFVRTYERGERVHLAMRARAYDGSMPDLAVGGVAGPPAWWAGAPAALTSAALVASVAVR